MNDMINNLKYSSLLLIYPDGYIDRVNINRKVLHMDYFIDLCKNSTRFQEIIDQENINMPKNISLSENILTTDVDTKLAKKGIVVLHNLFILEVLKNDEMIDNAPLLFYISLPDNLSINQKEIMNNLINKYDLSCCLYAIFNDFELVDISYDDILKRFNEKTK